MPSADILSADDFIFEPFVSGDEGDSGALQLATSKSDPNFRYIVKSSFSDLACNEFMYHHIATKLGLYTQEARLFKGMGHGIRAVGIRYVPSARAFIYNEATEINKHTYYKFRMLYVILNEEDSEEYFCDEHGQLFKLDNAESFHLSSLAVEGVLSSKGYDPPEWIWQILINCVNSVEYEKYGFTLSVLYRDFGRTALETAYGFIKQFSDFDLAWIEQAIETLGEVYPPEICEYYPAFMRLRIEACKRFITENTIEQFIAEGGGRE